MTKEITPTPATPGAKAALLNKVANAESYLHSLVAELEAHTKTALDDLTNDTVDLIAKFKAEL